MAKVAIIGAGNVGATTAFGLMYKGTADIALVDVADGVAQGKALDLMQAQAMIGHKVSIKGSTSYEIIGDADVVVITAGIARKPGMSREDLLQTNGKIITEVSGFIKKHAPNAIVIVVTNPLDVMCSVVKNATGFPAHRVMGMAGVLDAARYKTFVAEALDVCVKDVQGIVLGNHGDTMVPLPNQTTVGGVPLTELLPDETIQKIIARTRNGGAEIVSLLKTGSAYYAPAMAVADMVEAIILDQKRVLPVSAYLEGQYGLQNIYLGVPAILGKSGVEKIIVMGLSHMLQSELALAANITRENINNYKGE